MPLITETYYLSLTQDNRGILRLRCSQDDTLRTVNLKLYNNGSIFVIPSGISASVSGVKQNGAVFSKPCTISQDRESVVLQLSSDITNIDGIIVAEIVLNDGEGGRLGTSNFIIQVEKNPIRAGVVQDTETPIEYINDFIEKIQTLTARLNNLITPSGDPSLAEVVDARIGILDSTTYQTLGARLNAEFQKLSNALNGVTILESTGDTTDRTSEILSKLNAYGTCKLGKGDFYVNSLVMPEGSHLIGSGNSTRIILSSGVTDGYIVKPRSNCIIENISFDGGFTGTYSELIASGASATRHCIILDRFDSVNSENVILSNIFINNFVGSAIIQRYTTGCHCKDIIINMCYAGIDISNASYDGLCTNVYINNTKFGVIQNGSNFVFNSCISKDSAQHIMSDQQNTECTFSSCTFFDSSLETTARLANLSNVRNGFVFDNCMFDSSLSMTLNACDGIVIKGTNFVGSDTFIVTVSNGRNTLLLITDCIADVEPTVTNAGTAARIISCYLKDGTAWSISEADITVDGELSDESENPVQNKVINRAIGELKADLDDVKSDFGTSLTNLNPTFVDGRWTINATTNRVVESTGTARKRAVVPVVPLCTYQVTFCSYGTSSPVLIFTDAFKTVISSINGESERINKTVTLVAPQGAAYLFVTHDTYREDAVNPSIYRMFTSAYVDNQSDMARDLSAYLGAGIKSTTTLTGTEYLANITSGGNVTVSTGANKKVIAYAVENGKTYRLVGDGVKINQSLPIAGYGENAFDGTDSVHCDILIIDSTTATVETDYDVLFTAPDDGYIFVASYGTYATLTVTNAAYTSTVIDELNLDIVEIDNKTEYAKQLIQVDDFDFTLDDLFNYLESAYIDDFTVRSSIIDSDHPYTMSGGAATLPTFVEGVGVTRTGESGISALFYTKAFSVFPYYCLFGRINGGAQLIKFYGDSSISISPTGAISYDGVTYGCIHVNAAYTVLRVTSTTVTIVDDTGITVRIPLAYSQGKPMTIAFGFGANVGRLFGYGSFVEFVKAPQTVLDFNKCIYHNRIGESRSDIKSSIRFAHSVWSNGATNSFYYIPEDNPSMSLEPGLSNNPCINCIVDYADDQGYRTEIGVTPIKSTLHGKLGGLQRFKASADYYMSSEYNLGGNYYTYIFQLHNAGFTPPQGWPTDPPPLSVRIDQNGRLKAFVTYVATGDVPSSDNERTADEYDLGTFEMDKWMHLDVEARIGWSKTLAPRLVIKIDGQERLNIATPIGFNIVSNGGYVNTHFGLYCPQWHDAVFENMHREILVTNIHWQGTQNIN